MSESEGFGEEWLEKELTAEERADLLGEGEDDSGAEGEGEAGPGDSEAGGEGETGGEEDALEAEQLEAVLKQAPSAHIPKARFDEVNEKFKAAEAERVRLQALVDVKPQDGGVEVVEMERQYLDAVLDGEHELALELRAKINGALLQQAEESVERKLTAKETAREEAKAQATFNDTVQALVAEFPVLDSATGNQTAIAEVVEWRDFYIAKGFSAPDALDKAARKIAPTYSAGHKPAVTREQVAAERNADTSTRQPPKVDGVGGRGIAPVKVHSQEEWEKLPEAERKRLLE